jgi:hypothetical protein
VRLQVRAEMQGLDHLLAAERAVDQNLVRHAL